jgi:hypothetical protein
VVESPGINPAITFVQGQASLLEDFAGYGLLLSGLFINSITPPLDVQRAIDDKSRLGVFDDLDKLVKMKSAMAMEKAAESTSEAGAGLGMGLGFLLPSLLSRGAASEGAPASALSPCPACGQPLPTGARFCPVGPMAYVRTDGTEIALPTRGYPSSVSGRVGTTQRSP